MSMINKRLPLYAAGRAGAVPLAAHAAVLGDQANYIGLYALVAIGLVLLTGIGGMTSFGQAASSAWGPTPPPTSPPAHGVRPG
jgi:branched-chain amino acid transport system permease protein